MVFSEKGRVCLEVSLCKAGNGVRLRDVEQAYAQAAVPPSRLIAMECPPEMGLSEDFVLVLLRALYGLSEAGLLWYLTFSKFLIEQLGLTPTSLDNCLFYKRDERGLQALVAIQVDDALECGSVKFFEVENSLIRQHFVCKEMEDIVTSGGLNFDGGRLTMEGDTLLLSMEEHVARLILPSDQSSYFSTKQLCLYIAVACRPDILQEVQLLPQTVSSRDLSLLCETVQFLKRTPTLGLRYKPLQLPSPGAQGENKLQVVVFSDASFANAEDHSSQMGYILVLTDGTTANIIHYTSKRCRRITRSVFSSELLSLVEGYDMGAALVMQLEEILGVKLNQLCVVDSNLLTYSLEDCLRFSRQVQSRDRKEASSRCGDVKRRT